MLTVAKADNPLDGQRLGAADRTNHAKDAQERRETRRNAQRRGKEDLHHPGATPQRLGEEEELALRR